MSWQDEWPTEPGMYWFYGWRSLFAVTNSLPNLFFVKVLGTSKPGSMVYIEGGSFLFKGEGGYGKWLRVEPPELPRLPKPLDSKKGGQI